MKYIIRKNSVIILITLIFLYGCSSSGSNINTDDPNKAFTIAKKKFDNGDYTDAIEDFSFIKLNFPGKEIIPKTQFYLAESYYYQKENLLAAYEYEVFLKNYPVNELAPQAKYRLGVCYFNLSPKYSLDQEFTKYSITELQSFIEQFPTDKNVPDAKVKLSILKNKLALKDYKSGELYMKMDKYKSALIYFKNVVDVYIESEWADDALLGAIEALVQLKKYDEAKTEIENFYKYFSGSNLKNKVDRIKNNL